MGRRGILVVMFIVAVLTVYGCATTPAPAQELEVTNEPVPVVDSETESASEDPIKIGSISPLTGSVAFLGLNHKAGVELAVQEINDAGGINGRMVEVVYEDGLCEPKAGTNAANKLVNIDQVTAIVGGLCSPETLAAGPIVEEAGVPLVSSCSSNPSVTDAGDYVFRVYPSDKFQGKVGAEMAFNRFGAQKVAVLHCLNDWCLGLRDVFVETYEGLGGEIVATESFEKDSSDIRSQWLKVKESEPDLVYFLSFTATAISGLRQKTELGIETQALGGDAWDDPTIWNELGDVGDGAAFTTVKLSISDEYKSKVASYLNDQEVTICGPHAYDAMHILADVIAQVGDDPIAIKDELYNLVDYVGESGTIGFDENGDLASAAYDLKVVKGGTAVVSAD